MYYEELNKGDKITTKQRVVTETDIDMFAIMTGATNPIFIQDEVAKKLGFKGRIAPGALTFALTMGLFYGAGLFDHLVAFLGIDKLKFLAAVNPSDTIWCEAEVMGKKEIRGERGIVNLKWVVKNQEKEAVLETETTFMLQKKSPI